MPSAMAAILRFIQGPQDGLRVRVRNLLPSLSRMSLNPGHLRHQPTPTRKATAKPPPTKAPAIRPPSPSAIHRASKASGTETAVTSRSSLKNPVKASDPRGDRDQAMANAIAWRSTSSSSPGPTPARPW